MTNKGVRQGCVLSPLLFNIFLSDIQEKFDNCGDNILLGAEEISCLIWADDILILSETEAGLQRKLNNLSAYCNINKLEVNTDKTKVMTFNKTGRLMKREFRFRNTVLECVREYKYLGFIVTPSGEIKTGLEDLRVRSLKALIKIRKALGSHFHTDLWNTIHIFNYMVRPILLYCSDFWGCLKSPRNNPIEKFYLSFCKQLLGVRKQTNTIGVLLELGMVPIEFHAKKIAVRNWERICEENCNQLLTAAYTEAKTENLQWAETIKNVFSTNGMLDIYLSTTEPSVATPINQTVHRPQPLYDMVQLATVPTSTTGVTTEGRPKAEKTPSTLLFEKLSDQFHQTALANLENSSKLKLYSQIKTEIGPEKYLSDLTNVKHRQALTKLRLSSHRLQIEVGRHTNGDNEIPREDRICPLCRNGVEDEVHFLLTCPIYKDLRKHIHGQLMDAPGLSDLDQTVHLLLQYNIKMVAKFIYEAFTIREDAITAQGTLEDIITQIEKSEKVKEDKITKDAQNTISSIIWQIEKTEKHNNLQITKDVHDTIDKILKQVIRTEKLTHKEITKNVQGALEDMIQHIESTNKAQKSVKKSAKPKFYIAENSHDHMRILLREGTPIYSITKTSKDGLKMRISRRPSYRMSKHPYAGRHKENILINPPCSSFPHPSPLPHPPH